MPWCPKCKNEYRAGFTTCPDCNVKLVDNINDSPLLPLCSFDNKEVEHKFCSYLEYSKIEFTDTTHNDMDFIAVDKSVMSDAVKALRAFCDVEEGIFLKKQIDSTYLVLSKDTVMEALENEMQTEDPEEVENEVRKQIVRSQTSSVYESSKNKASEFHDSGYMLITLGIIGLIVIVLDVCGVISLFGSLFSEIVMGVMFAGMIIGGVLSIRSSKQYEQNAVIEDKLEERIKEWLETSLSPEDIKKVDDPSNGEEENYLLRIDYIKDRLLTSVGGISQLDENFVDSIIEDYYNKTFGE